MRRVRVHLHRNEALGRCGQRLHQVRTGIRCVVGIQFARLDEQRRAGEGVEGISRHAVVDPTDRVMRDMGCELQAAVGIQGGVGRSSRQHRDDAAPREAHDTDPRRVDARLRSEERERTVGVWQRLWHPARPAGDAAEPTARRPHINFQRGDPGIVERLDVKCAPTVHPFCS